MTMLSQQDKTNQVFIAKRISLNSLKEATHETKPPTEKYSVGWFDGLIGENPMYPENSEYWSGYSLGYREYWCKEKGVTLSDRF